jgi:molybdopterin converting factor small subunit
VHITLKLYAGLGEYLPREARDNAVAVRIGAGSSPHVVLDRFRVPRERAHLVLINGLYVPRTERDSRPLADGDIMAVWPPVAGG